MARRSQVSFPFSVPSKGSVQLQHRHIDLPVRGTAGTGEGQAELGGRGGADNEMGRAAGTGAIDTGGKVDPRLQVGGSIVGGRDLHIAGLAENAGHFIGNEIIPGRQSDAGHIRLGNVPGGVRYIGQKNDLGAVAHGILGVQEGGKAVLGRLAGGPGGANLPLGADASRDSLGAGGAGRGDVKRKVAINPQTMGNYKKIKSITLRMEPSGTTWAAFLRG